MLSLPDLLSLLSIFETMSLGFNNTNSSSSNLHSSDSFSHPALHPEEWGPDCSTPDSKRRFFINSSSYNQTSSDLSIEFLQHTTTSTNFLAPHSVSSTASQNCQKVVDSSLLQKTSNTQVSNRSLCWQFNYWSLRASIQLINDIIIIILSWLTILIFSTLIDLGHFSFIRSIVAAIGL